MAPALHQVTGPTQGPDVDPLLLLLLLLLLGIPCTCEFSHEAGARRLLPLPLLLPWLFTRQLCTDFRCNSRLLRPRLLHLLLLL
jgi:hypothetical protein